MKEKIRKFVQKLKISKLTLPQRLKNKYVAAFLIFFVWVLFFDDNNLISHRRNKHRLSTLKEQRDSYREKIAADNLKMEELRSGQDNLEKYAREQFLMSKPGEDVFVVVED